MLKKFPDLGDLGDLGDGAPPHYVHFVLSECRASILQPRRQDEQDRTGIVAAMVRRFIKYRRLKRTRPIMTKEERPQTSGPCQALV